MEALPLFFKLHDRQALVFGDGHEAIRKIQLLVKASCKVVHVANSPSQALKTLDGQNLIEHRQDVNDVDWDGADLVVASTGDTEQDLNIASKAKGRGIPVNVLNNASESTYLFPSIIDRSPIIAAVSSGGELPILSRILRTRIESTIPHAYGRLATLAQSFKDNVRAKLPTLTARRRFWESVLEGRVADLLYSGKENEAAELLQQNIDSLETGAISDVGEVYLVGAGPGDPDLLTFKALRLIRQADIVLYDRLVSEPILGLVKQDAQLVNVGKERSNHLVPQDSINDLLVHYAKQGKRVLRLKGGDPFIFGRGGEEIETLAEQGVPFQVVPGITAAAGCAAYSGIPLTHRDYSQSVRFVTGHLKNDSCDLPWQEFVHDNQTLVFYMGLTGLPIISQSLISYGMKETTPVALVSRGTTRHQEVYVGDLSTISDIASANQVKAPTIIIIGNVVSLREKLKWRSD